jgi:hypothetical protein
LSLTDEILIIETGSFARLKQTKNNMKNQIYNNAKAILTAESKQLKATTGKKDKAYIRTVLNDLLDSTCRDLNRLELKEVISAKQNKIYQNWLTNYTIKLHP